MNTSSGIKIEKPNIIEAMLAGFNTIASNPYLIIPPVILDLFLWFGPAWRVDKFFLPILQNLTVLPGMDLAEYQTMIQNANDLWYEVITNFNLATTLRTLPVGIPSLMASKQPFLNPLGAPTTFSLQSSLQVIGMWMLFLLIEFFFGNVYMNSIAGQIIENPESKSLKSLLRSFLQVILLPVVLVIILLILSIPLLLLVSLTSLFSPAIGQITIFLAGIILLWAFLPLIFTAHGIFLYKQNLIAAMMTSISIVKVSMTQTTWFILLSFVLVKGLNFLWRSPAVDNWFLIIGIFGHAFVITAVITSSFHYFIDATRFTQTLLNRKTRSA